MFDSVAILEPAAKPWVKVIRVAAPVAVVIVIAIALFLHRHDVVDPILSLFR